MNVRFRMKGAPVLKLRFALGLPGQPGEATPEFIAMVEQATEDAATATAAASTATTGASTATTQAGIATAAAAAADADAATINGLLNMPLDMGDQSEPYVQTYDLGVQGT